MNENQNFIKELKEKTGEEVVRMELSELRADDSTYRILNLKKSKGRTSIWGLTVVTESSVYFYAPKSTTTYFSIPVNTGEEQKDQLVKLTSLNKIKFAVLKTSFFTNIFNPEVSRTISATFTDSSDAYHTFNIVLNNKAQTIIELFNQRI